MEDIIIIGSGIIGSFLAYDLSKYEGKITVLERQHDVANEVTMANSAIVHTGYDPHVDTLKAKLNVLGAQMYPNVCAELHADYQKIGSYVLAHDEEEILVLKELQKNCEKRKIAYKNVLQDELQQQEKNISNDVLQGLYVPDTAIIYPWQVATYLMETAIENGVTLELDQEVDKIEVVEGGYRIYAKDRFWDSKMIINAAGLGAEGIAQCLHEKPFSISYKRGQYYVLSKLAKDVVHHVLYPVPTKKGKGVLALPTTHGNILLGPTAEWVNDVDLATNRDGLSKIDEHMKSILKDVPMQEVIRTFSGIRPCGNDGDFYIQESKKHPNVYHVACIDSPGLASAPAISQYVIHELMERKHTFKQKAIFHKRRPSMVVSQMTKVEREALIQKDARYGRIICRCEKISEGEIIDAIHRPCGATTIKGVKKRVRPGMGKCQGGFCEVEVAKILSRELNIPLKDVLYDAIDSKLGEEVK